MGTTNYDEVDVIAGAAVSTAGAATLNTQVGQVTTEALTTASGATYTFTLTNNNIKATSIVLATIGKGTATTGEPVVQFCTPAANGTAVILIRNVAAAAALNGTITINFAIFNLAG